MPNQAERIVYPTLQEFYDGLRVYHHHCPHHVYREARDPRGGYLGVTDGQVTHLVTMGTWREYYAIVHFSDPGKYQRSFGDYQETVALILGASLKGHRHGQ